MPTLLVVGGGLFGSLAAAYARRRGIEALVFDPALDGAASPAAAGLFAEKWAGNKLREHYHKALPLLEALYALVSLKTGRERKAPLLVG
jgi:glycine/D-amino acid oxidase-like deaminating enzyme